MFGQQRGDVMTEILIVEDDQTLNDGIVLALKREEYHFDQSFSYEDARRKIKEKEYQLFLLDVNLPNGSGYDLLKEIRSKGRTPVLMLTANDMEMDEVMGLELGADDYMTKPFSLAVLRARIHNLLRRQEVPTNDYQSGEFSFRFDEMVFRKGGREIFLSKTEQKLLGLLVKNVNQALPRDVLVDRLWTDGAEYVDENALSVSIRRLREKIEDNPSKPVHIQTVYGVGYVWKEE